MLTSHRSNFVFKLFLVCLLACALTLTGESSVYARQGNSTSEITCLTQAIFYEARGESTEGKILVALVVRARTEDAQSRWPKTICGVVWQRSGKGCQFSWACGHRAAFRPTAEMQQIAQKVYSGALSMPKGFEHVRYFATSRQAYMHATRRVGGHVFG